MLPGSYPHRKYMVCMVWNIIKSDFLGKERPKFSLTLSGAGVWRLSLGRGGNTPPLRSNINTALWNLGKFDHFGTLPTTLNVIWLKKVAPNLPFSYLGKVKKNWQLFPSIFFGESQKYERGGVFHPPPAPDRVKCISQAGYYIQFRRREQKRKNTFSVQNLLPVLHNTNRFCASTLRSM